MFKSLLIYEFEKFWSKKINIACFLVIPLIVFMALKGCIELNPGYGIASPAFGTNMNFHIISLQEMIVSAFNGITIIFFALSFNEEYQSGCLRMAFIRPISIKKLYLAKTVILIVNLFLIMLLQLLISLIIAQIFLPTATKTLLFFKSGVYGAKGVIIYSFKFYLLSFINLLVLGAVTELFSTRCKTVTGVIGGSLGFLVGSAVFFCIVIGRFKGIPESNSRYFMYASLSLIFTEFKGNAYFAAGVSNICLYSLIIMLIVFKVISFFRFTKKDYLE
ncbi:ABC transporter permease [Clostridium estertheticum]|uniref:ABC transporter permease n=1 Tax=Clostridium estertheticum TaxID=238834 RepID=UPI001C0E2A3B|nr:ABC transporter permease [Clostridium estertheticum]MBU3183380.1 ABC transporter permease [Clostridium estertheticum]MCB2338927.1 ABC transporter permease [Clostridium estertheticum]